MSSKLVISKILAQSFASAINEQDLFTLIRNIREIIDESKTRGIELSWFLDENFASTLFGGKSIWEIFRTSREESILVTTIFNKSRKVNFEAIGDIQGIVDLLQTRLFSIVSANLTEYFGANYTCACRESFVKVIKHGLISNPPDKDLLISYLEALFLNIYFNSTVKSELNGLSEDYRSILKTIFFHLDIVNEKFYKKFLANPTIGASMVCEQLTGDLSSSPILVEVSRDTPDKSNLNYTFKDGSVSKIVYTSLHTKFKGYFENDSWRDRGDRIYFSQPINGFLNGRILLSRIGAHS